MNHRYSIAVENPLRVSFDTYLSDPAAALTQIAALDRFECKQLLHDLYVHAPHALAKALAIRYPWSADIADRAERIVQECLPLG